MGVCCCVSDVPSRYRSGLSPRRAGRINGHTRNRSERLLTGIDASPVAAALIRRRYSSLSPILTPGRLSLSALLPAPLINKLLA